MINTTMFCESYHNVLKHTLFNRRRQNRMDYVIYVLLVISVEWFSKKMLIQNAGQNTTSYAQMTKAQRDDFCLASSYDIADVDIQVDADAANFDSYLVIGTSVDPQQPEGRPFYSVRLPLDLDCLDPSKFTCTCLDYQRWQQYNCKCKHIHAAKRARAEALDVLDDISATCRLEETNADATEAEVEAEAPDHFCLQSEFVDRETPYLHEEMDHPEVPNEVNFVDLSAIEDGESAELATNVSNDMADLHETNRATARTLPFSQRTITTYGQGVLQILLDHGLSISMAQAILSAFNANREGRGQSYSATALPVSTEEGNERRSLSHAMGPKERHCSNESGRLRKRART